MFDIDEGEQKSTNNAIVKIVLKLNSREEYQSILTDDVTVPISPLRSTTTCQLPA
jgi:hypothetical protein